MLLSTALRIQSKDVIALAGGGGKTTAMFRLAEELRALDQRVVTTMTTKIFVWQMERAPARLVLEGTGTLLAQLPALLAEHGHVLIAGGTIVEQDKVQGVTPELLDRVAAHPAVDAVIVEADGSRRLPFKAPAAHEPVIPASATILAPMVGLDVVGQPLDEAHVHRPGLAAALTGAAIGDPVTPELVAAVLAHPDGGAKGLSSRCRLVPILNKVTAERLPAARQIARLLLAHPSVDSVLIAAVAEPDPVREVWSRVGAVVLAAGQAKRFGALKQVLPWRGVPLVAHVTAQALACPDIARVAVTVGAQAARVTAALGEIPAAFIPNLPSPVTLSGSTGQRTPRRDTSEEPQPPGDASLGSRRNERDLVNPLSMTSSRVMVSGAAQETILHIVPVPNWAAGQSRSVLAGLEALAAPTPAPSPVPTVEGSWPPPQPPPPSQRGRVGVGAILFLLADQPGVTPELLAALIQRHRETLAPVVAPRHAGQRGNPVLFDRATFPEFAALRGDIGARPVIQAHADEIAWVDWPTPEILQDIDTPEAYRGSQPAS